MSVDHTPGGLAEGEGEWEPVFIREGRNIFLRCRGDDGRHLGDLLVAEATMDVHADTLTNAANAGMRFMAAHVVDRAIDRILGEGETT